MINIESADITERLVGIAPVYLNKFVQLGNYSISASIQSGKVRAQRRLFSRDDVFAIALAWMLFESGLRTKPIRRVLNQLGKTKKADANLVSRKLLQSQAEYLVIVRQPRGPGKHTSEDPEQQVSAVKKSEVAAMIEKASAASVLVIPVGQKFADLQKRMEVLFPGE